MADDEQAGPDRRRAGRARRRRQPTEHRAWSDLDRRWRRRKVAGLATREVPGVGAGLGAGVSAYRRGELDLVELQDRLAPRDPRRRR